MIEIINYDTGDVIASGFDSVGEAAEWLYSVSHLEEARFFKIARR